MSSVSYLGYRFVEYFNLDKKYNSVIIHENKKGKAMKNNDFVIEGTTLVKADKSIKTAVIPDFITVIGEEAFEVCDMLTSVKIPSSVTTIEDSAFSFCSSLTNIEIPSSVKNIGWYAFSNCSSLTAIKIPDSVHSIEAYAFSDCTSLKHVEIPPSVISIEGCAFSRCSSLTEVELPSSVTVIGECAFNCCAALKKINIPSSVANIGAEAFYGCSSLTDIDIPNSVTFIGDHAFGECSSLTSVKIPSSVTRIENATFYECSSLTSIEIPASVTNIGLDAFWGCSSLTRIEIPSSVKSVGSHAFYACLSLTDIKINLSKGDYRNIDGLLDYWSIPDTAIITKSDDGLVLEITKNKPDTILENQILVKDMMLLNYYINFFEDRSKCDKLATIDKKYVKYIYQRNNEKLNNGDEIDYDEIFNCNFKSLNNLLKVVNLLGKTDQDIVDFYKLCENLGVMNSKPTQLKFVSKSGGEKIERVDYAQKAREFLKDRILDGTLNINKMHAMFDSMKMNGFNRKFADFFFNKKNFEELLQEERHQSGFIARCYNEFDIVQSAHTSQRGSQRQLAPTVDFFKEYFMANKFSGITKETRLIADAISAYYSNQDDFDNAVKIDEERKKANVPDDIIVGESIKERDVFERVDALREDTRDVAIDTTAMLVDLASKKFTYEFLKKSDPTNFILGKLCSCCAHLEGAGNGIMRASIVHPDVQNIVIRDKTGKIVAKSTLYINRQEGYGVCNNVEVNNNVSADDKILIYLKYKKAVEIFAQEYNAKYPELPLKIITVGMHLNDLSEEIQTHHKKSTILYKALDYGKYAFNGRSYNGDSSISQYTIWQDSNSNDECGI